MCSLGRARHPDAEGVVEKGELKGPEKLSVRVDALIKAVDPFHFDCLHGVLAGHWSNKKTAKKIGSNTNFVCTCDATEYVIFGK